MENKGKQYSQANSEAEYIARLFKEVKDEAAALRIPISEEISGEVIINKRARHRFGCCKKIKSGSKESFIIELSERLLPCKEMVIKQTLAHEVLHTCPKCQNHGELWKRYAEQMNSTYGYRIKRVDTAEQLGIIDEGSGEEMKRRVNYRLACKNCGAVIERSRMSKAIKYPNKYRCRCGGKLERVQ